MHSNYNEIDSPAMTPTSPTHSGFYLDFTAYESAWKNSASIPVLVIQKINNIIDDYYKLAPQLKKRQDQLSVLLKYNSKLLQTIEQFRIHQKRIVDKFNTLSNLYIKSFKKYCQNKHLDMNFSDFKEMPSIFQKFSMKDWKFQPDQPKKNSINKKYKDRLLNIFKKFYFSEKDSHKQVVQDLIKSMKNNQQQNDNYQNFNNTKVEQIQQILKNIIEYNSKAKNANVNNMFDLLQERKIIEMDVRYLQDQRNFKEKYKIQNQQIRQKLKANLRMLDAEDLQFVNEVKKLHSSLQNVQAQTLKSFISNEKQRKIKLKKQEAKIRNKFQKCCNALYEENTELKEQIQRMSKHNNELLIKINQHNMELQFNSIRQSINKKQNANSSVDQTIISGLGRKKEKSEDYKAQLKKTQNSLLKVSCQLWTQKQLEQIGLKRQKIDDKLISLKQIHQKLKQIDQKLRKCSGRQDIQKQLKEESQKQKNISRSSSSNLKYLNLHKRQPSQAQSQKQLQAPNNEDDVLKSVQEVSNEVGQFLYQIKNMAIKICKDMQLEQKLDLSRSNTISPELLKALMDQKNHSFISISQPPNLQKSNAQNSESSNNSRSIKLGGSDRPIINIMPPPLQNNKTTTSEQRFNYNNQMPISPIYQQSGTSLWNLGQANLVPIQQQSKCDESRNMDFSHGSQIKKSHESFMNNQRSLCVVQDIKKSQSFSYKPSQQNQGLNKQNQQKSHNYQLSQHQNQFMMLLSANQQKSRILSSMSKQHKLQIQKLKIETIQLRTQIDKHVRLLRQHQQKYNQKLKQNKQLQSQFVKHAELIGKLKTQVQELSKYKHKKQTQTYICQNIFEKPEQNEKIDQIQRLSQRYHILKKDLQQKIQLKKQEIKQLEDTLLEKQCHKSVAVQKLKRFQSQNIDLNTKVSKLQNDNIKFAKLLAQKIANNNDLKQKLKEVEKITQIIPIIEAQHKQKIDFLSNNYEQNLLKTKKIQSQNTQLQQKCNKVSTNLQLVVTQKDQLLQKFDATNKILAQVDGCIIDLSMHSIKSNQILSFLKIILQKYSYLMDLFDHKKNQKCLSQCLKKIIQLLNKQDFDKNLQKQLKRRPNRLLKKHSIQNTYDLNDNKQQLQSFSLKNDESFHSHSQSPPQSFRLCIKKAQTDEHSQISAVPLNNKHKISKKMDDIQFLNVFNCTNSEQKINNLENSKVNLKISKKISQIQNLHKSEQALMYSKPQQIQDLVSNMNKSPSPKIQDKQLGSQDGQNDLLSNLLTEVQRTTNDILCPKLIDQKLLKQVQKQLEKLKNNPQALDLYQIYKKYKQALQCLDFQCQRNRKRELQYRTYLKSLNRTISRAGTSQNIKLRLQEKLYFSERRIEQQREQLQQQRREFQGQIKKIIKQSEQISNNAIQIIRKSLMEKVMANILKIPKN